MRHLLKLIVAFLLFPTVSFAAPSVGTLVNVWNSGTGHIAGVTAAGGLQCDISGTTVPLPTGAATEATLSTLNGKFSSLGQKTMSASTPVAIASDQSALPISGTVVVSSTTANQGTPNTIGNAWPEKITDGTNTAAVKAASTSAGAADPSLASYSSDTQTK